MERVQPPPPVASLRATAARNRARILDAAREALADGDHVLGANTLAMRAGVGVGTVYRYFPNRQALLEGLAEQAFGLLVSDVRDAARHPDAATGLRDLIGAALRRMAEDPGLAEVLSLEKPICIETVGLGEQLGQVASDLVERARNAGALRHDLDVDDLRRLLVGVHTAGHLSGAAAQHRERYCDVLIAGLRAGRTQPAA